ncbi:MAG: FtsQ-type POTRA domain-containing protein [Deltaproteobacteria bacterium]|nr:FtsQ-type POTRA domain-containing protein [Deltaproteobacteria bacterium]
MYLGKTRLGVPGRNVFQKSLQDGGPGWFQRIWRHFWIGSIIVMILAGLSLTMLIGYLFALSAPFFRLEDVSIQGNRRVSQVELLQKGGLEDKVNLLALNLRDVKKRLEAVPWIKAVQLRRELPNKLTVLVQEREPLSLVLFSQGLYFLDAEGVPFKKADRQETSSLPVVTGLQKADWQENGRLDPRILQDLLLLKTLLARGKDPLYPEKLSEIHVDPDCGYSLYTLDRGVRITLGQEELTTRLNRLEKVWSSLQGRSDLFQLRGISLQYGQRVVVHGLKPAAGGKKS